MYKVKIKTSYDLMGFTYKAEKTDNFQLMESINNMVGMRYEDLLYIYEQLNVCNYELQYKIDDEEWKYFNSYDYCNYLKNRYFKNNDHISAYTLLNHLDNMKFTRFICYIRGLRENEK